jgi:hypothetical protein
MNILWNGMPISACYQRNGRMRLAGDSDQSGQWTKERTFLGTDRPADQTLATNEWLSNSLHTAFAIVQQDGNLCVYKGSSPENKQGVIWCSSSARPLQPGNYFAKLESDGNLCVYPGTSEVPRGASIWCSGSSRGNNKYKVILGDDTNLCVYNATGTTIWCQNTSGLMPSS